MANAGAAAQIPHWAQGAIATVEDDGSGALVEPANWTLFRSLPMFDLRNGDLSEITPVLMKATIPDAYKWVPVGNLGAQHHAKAIDASIRSHLAHLNDNPNTAIPEAKRRKAAIVLGTARAVATAYYRLSTADMIAGEFTNPILVASTVEDNNITCRVRQGYAGAGLTALNTPLNLTDDEEAAICAIVKCAIGVIAMQGYSLVMTNHHYLSDNQSQSRKVFQAAEKAYWKSTDVAAWFTEDQAMIQDLLWHKATHPVMIHIKTRTAMDPSVAAKLEAAGAGACASRLPAVEADLRAANSYITLFATVTPMFRMFDGRVNIEALVETVEVVKAYPPGVAAPTGPFRLPQHMVGIVTNRLTALAFLKAMLRRNTDSAAFCYGFYCALSDANLTIGGTTAAATDTLKTSYSLAKLRQQSYASYVEGNQAYGDYVAVRNARRQRGEFVAPDFHIN